MNFIFFNSNEMIDEMIDEMITEIDETDGEACLRMCNEIILSGGTLCEYTNYKYGQNEWIYNEDCKFINYGYWEYDAHRYTLTLEEYNRLWMLFKSEGCNDVNFIRNFYAGDYEMVTTWMRYVRDVQRKTHYGDIMRVKKYSQKFNLDCKDILDFMFPDQAYMDNLIRFMNKNGDVVYYKYTKRGHKHQKACVSPYDETMDPSYENIHYYLYVGDIRILEEIFNVSWT
jgi:hypothetical protein